MYWGFLIFYHVPRLPINNVPRICVVSFNPKTEKKCPDDTRIDVQVVIDFALVLHPSYLHDARMSYFSSRNLASV